MPKRKDLKRLIRARMDKTGEAYTAARARILKQHTPPAAELAALAGMSDAAVKDKTGRNWKQWVGELDRADAVSMSHRDIAKHVHASYEVSGWWAQMVTVGYERIRGLRALGQRRTTGKFDANKSKTFPVPVARLYRAFSTKRTRNGWLAGVELKIRTSTVNRSMRISWPDGTSVHVWFTDKGPDKSSVAVQHVGLAAKRDVDKAKAYWAKRFVALGQTLA